MSIKLKTTFTMALSTLFIMILLSGSIYANIICTTPNKNIQFSLADNTITFIESPADYNNQDRGIASLSTKNSVNGLTKILLYEGNKYTLHIENFNNFSDLKDYLIIKSSKGHEITYPLICQ